MITTIEIRYSEISNFHMGLKEQFGRAKKISFADRVNVFVKSIPRGQTRTYKQVATAAGSPDAARAVGNIMRVNTDRSIPCHRVVRSDGKVGGYNGLRGQSKLKILSEEKHY